MSRLLARFEVLRQSCTAPSTTDDDILAVLAQHARRHPQRVLSAYNASQVRSDAVRGRIRAAWGRRSLVGDIDKQKVDICMGSLENNGRWADPRTVRDELRIMQTEAGMSDAAGASAHALSIGSTGG